MTRHDATSYTWTRTTLRLAAYEQARQVLGGWGWTCNPFANPIARAAMDPLSQEISRSSMLVTDSAVHQRLRGSVRDVFTRSFATASPPGSRRSHRR